MQCHPILYIASDLGGAVPLYHILPSSRPTLSNDPRSWKIKGSLGGVFLEGALVLRIASLYTIPNNR